VKDDNKILGERQNYGEEGRGLFFEERESILL
jgi:hypothetical protein